MAGSAIGASREAAVAASVFFDDKSRFSLGGDRQSFVLKVSGESSLARAPEQRAPFHAVVERCSPVFENRIKGWKQAESGSTAAEHVLAS
jgi:hypothetical protein